MAPRQFAGGLQARAGIDAGAWTEADMAAVAARTTGKSVDELLAAPYVADPLRAHDIAPFADAAAAVILASEERARELVANPAFITGWDHRIDSPNFGARDLTASPSTTLAGDTAFGDRSRAVDVAEIHAAFTHEELIVKQAPTTRLGADQSVRRCTGRKRVVLRRPATDRLRRARDPRRRRLDGSRPRVGRAGPATEHGRHAGFGGGFLMGYRNRAAVLGTGQTKYVSKRPDVTMAGMCREAIDAALADAGSRSTRSTPSSSARPPTCSRAP